LAIKINIYIIIIFVMTEEIKGKEYNGYN